MLKQVQRFRLDDGKHSEDFCLCEPVHTILTFLHEMPTNVEMIPVLTKQIPT